MCKKKKKSEPSKCDVFFKLLSDKYSLQRHMKIYSGECVSSERRMLEKKKKKSEPNKCDICFKLLSNKYSLRKHMKIHYGV